MAALTGKRDELSDAVSTAAINRRLARQAVDRAGWALPAETLRAWHKYLQARAREAHAEDELFAHDLEQALAAVRR